LTKKKFDLSELTLWVTQELNQRIYTSHILITQGSSKKNIGVLICKKKWIHLETCLRALLVTRVLCIIVWFVCMSKNTALLNWYMICQHVIDEGTWSLKHWKNHCPGLSWLWAITLSKILRQHCPCNMHHYISLYYDLSLYQVSWISVKEFKRSCEDKKTMFLDHKSFYRNGHCSHVTFTNCDSVLVYMFTIKSLPRYMYIIEQTMVKHIMPKL
jgi:hypothetical protein